MVAMGASYWYAVALVTPIYRDSVCDIATILLEFSYKLAINFYKSTVTGMMHDVQLTYIEMVLFEFMLQKC